MAMTRRQLLLRGASLPFFMSASACGYLLYPEREGRSGGRIDTPILIVDLVWLLPGLIPGVICLAVDFSTGCIYRSGGRRASRERSGETLAGQTTTAAVVLDDEVVAHTLVQPESEAALRWNRAVDEKLLKARGTLLVHRSDGARAEVRLADVLA